MAKQCNHGPEDGQADRCQEEGPVPAPAAAPEVEDGQPSEGDRRRPIAQVSNDQSLQGTPTPLAAPPRGASGLPTRTSQPTVTGTRSNRATISPGSAELPVARTRARDTRGPFSSGGPAGWPAYGRRCPRIGRASCGERGG